MASKEKRHSKFHPQRPCSKCALCGKLNAYYSHYQTWSEDEKKFLITHWGSEPDASSCICIAHYKEAQRAHPPGYRPKWSTLPLTPVSTPETCMYPSCTSTTKLCSPSFAPTSELKVLLQLQSDTQPITVCGDHYNQLYRQIHKSPQHCFSCGIKPKRGTTFTRHCPNPSLINAYLNESGESEEISPSHCICLSCYKAHLAIIKMHEQNNTLADLADIWKHALSDENNDELTRATLRSALYVADEFRNQRAVLLPHVSRVFLREYEDLLSTDHSDFQEHQMLEGKEGTIKFTSSWLLKKLKMYLSKHIECKCIHKKIGTVLFRKGGDLLASLSFALGAARTNQDQEVLYEPNPPKKPDVVKVLREAGDIVNNLLHVEMAKSPAKELDIDAEIGSINPLLWSFLESITRSVRQREGLPETNCAVKRLRRYIIFSLLCYCSNTKRTTLLHNILADTIEVCGGSRKLMKIFNRLGFVSSPSTHDEFVTSISEVQRSKSLWDSLPRDTFTLASVDNFDKLQSHAAVYCGDQHRSYHGTIVQIVQPDPSVKIVFPTNCTQPITQPETPQVPSLTTANPHSATQSLKHSIEFSPASSPHKLGKVGPKRPRTLVARNLTEMLQAASSKSGSSSSIHYDVRVSNATLEGFKEQVLEKSERESLESKILAYMFAKAQLETTEKLLIEFKDLYAYSSQTTVNISNIQYMEIIDENPDSSDTMRQVSDLLLSTVNSEHQGGYVVLVGDGKTYQHLTEIKRLYGSALSKLLIFPGDWHVLANFQPVLMKIYYSAGLKELAQTAGFRGETLTSLEKCSHFKRTHQFLLQVWQALFRALIASFDTLNPSFPEVSTVYDEDSTIRTLLAETESLVKNSGREKAFKTWLSSLLATDDTVKFWCQFIFADCFAYIQLYIAIRCQNWELRVSALKLMAPLFSAYDRTTYQRLIPHHLAELQKFPERILNGLKQGFTVAITGSKGHAVGLDEGHEMCVNKDLKMAMSRSSTSYLQKYSLFLNYRIFAHKNLLRQIYPKLNHSMSPLFSFFSEKAEIKEREDNIVAMLGEIKKKCVFPTACPSENRGVVNLFSGIEATEAQAHDLLNFRNIGQKDLESYINYYILKNPSTPAPVRKNKLLTMGSKKTTKRSVSLKEKELKQVNKCLRQRLAWCNHTGSSYNTSTEQYSPYPRALCDENGLPLKGTKSVWKDKLKKRYSEPQVVFEVLPNGWIPQAVVIDGMFLINCKPLRSTATLKEYGKFIFNSFLLPHYQANVKEIHLLFDETSPATTQDFNPKLFEQARRDQGHSQSQSHVHESFTPLTPLVPLLKSYSWRDYLNCRTCKRSMIQALGLAYMQSIRLQQDQTLYLSGCFSEQCAVKIVGESLPEKDMAYKSNSSEVDMRCWRHAHITTAQRILIYSPDTDIYNIGLSILPKLPGKEVIIQLNVPKSQLNLYLHLNKLVQALELDPDVATLPKCELPLIFQMLFICSGCDYVSYFAGLGKANFFNVFFQHAKFITGQQMGSLLSECTETKKKNGFLAFQRLIGTLYFKKHYAAMASRKDVQTPQQLFNSHRKSAQPHQEWYNDIRAIVSERITDERDRMPSHTALWRHWLRCCWVAQMWANSAEVDLYESLPPPETSGWRKNEDGVYEFDWECPNVQQNVQETIDFLTKGCSCKKGCMSRRCGCFGRGKQCGPGCQCQNCLNTVHAPLEEPDSSSEESDTASESEDDIETEIISDLFDELNDFSIEF